MDGIDRDAWAQALRELAPIDNDPSTLTMAELGEMFGMSRTALQSRVRKMLADGKIERSMKFIIDATGRRQRVAAYRLVKPSVPETGKGERRRR